MRPVHRSEALRVLKPLLLPGQLKIAVEVACTDLTGAQIASDMFLSVNTVKTQMRLTYRRCGITPRGDRHKLREFIARSASDRPPCA